MVEKISPKTIKGSLMIYHVPFSADLANILADELLKRYQDDPFNLAQVQLILPTKRACLAVKNAFLNKNKTTLLPHMLPIYELDPADEFIPDAISDTERLILLARLCLAKPNVMTHDQALKMAISLEELLDTAYQFDLDLSHLDELVQIERFAIHWQETVQFLDILHTHWPKILKERNQIDHMDRVIRLIRSFTKDLKKHPEQTIFMAGFLDSFPAVNELVEVVSKGKKNLVFEQKFTDKKTNCKDYLFEKLPQEEIIIEALTNNSWAQKDFNPNVLKNVHLIETENTREEALTIALLLRQTLETPNKTAALVTTDRSLARQVISQMQRWDILLDDSAGKPLNHTDIGIFFCLIADLGRSPNGVNYLSLLKHPLVADGQDPINLRQAVQAQEKLLRGKKQHWEMALNTDFSEWIDLFKNNTMIPFKTLLSKHLELAEQLATSADKTATQRLWQNDTGKQVFSFFSDLLIHADMIGEIESQTYPDILKLLMQRQSVRPRYGTHPRLDILGPIEARFSHADVCIIGGLNEGVFPALPDTDPWLNRPTRTKLGIPLPEEKIKELSIDFAHNFCSKEVYLTRSIKIDGAQAVPSRFVERLKAVVEINHLKLPKYRANLALLIDTPAQYDKPKRPEPCPPVEDRPNRLPITQIEMWRRNPYGIYARYILNLYPLNTLEAKTNNALFGELIHKVIQEFLTRYPFSTDRQLLFQTAQEVFDENKLSDVDKNLLNIRFSAIADFLIQQQTNDSLIVKKSLCEEKIEQSFDIDGQPFTLYGTADRVDTLKNKTLRVIDYKTYHPPKKKEVTAGFSPQLVLEALLLSEKQELPVSNLTYWYLSNKIDASEVQPITESKAEIDDLIQKSKDGLSKIIRAFRNEKTPYEVCPIPSQSPLFNDYAHLARMQEWATAEEDE